MAASIAPFPSASPQHHQLFTGFLEPGFGFRLAKLTRGKAPSRSRALAPPPCTGPAITRTAKSLQGRPGWPQSPRGLAALLSGRGAAFRRRHRPCRTVGTAEHAIAGGASVQEYPDSAGNFATLSCQCCSTFFPCF